MINYSNLNLTDLNVCKLKIADFGLSWYLWRRVDEYCCCWTVDYISNVFSCDIALHYTTSNISHTLWLYQMLFARPLYCCVYLVPSVTVKQYTGKLIVIKHLFSYLIANMAHIVSSLLYCIVALVKDRQSMSKYSPIWAHINNGITSERSHMFCFSFFSSTRISEYWLLCR